MDPITGTFSVARPGRLTLVWDNNYSWFNTKTLAYSITLHVPSLLTQERARCERAQQAMRKMAANKVQLRERTAQNGEAQIQASAAFVARRLQELELQILELQHQMEAERSASDSLRAEAAMLRARGATTEAKLRGLTFRVLNADLLGRVLAFRAPTGDPWTAVCREWLEVCTRRPTRRHVEHV
ncbi:unnamed protein product [Phaeothamnion confervicola]